MVEVSKDIDGLRSLSQLFSAANLKRIVIGQDLSSTKTRLKKYVNIDGQTSYNKLYKEIYKQLFKNYRNEYFYKKNFK